MGCNAWNHPKNCNCGWGGQGYGRSHAPYKETSYSNYLIENTVFSSFTIPNLQCHYCGASIFYYENSNGSKVWFDELGPPWHKHDCYYDTDFPKSPIQTVNKSSHGGQDHPSQDFHQDTNNYLAEPCLIEREISRGTNTYFTAKRFDPQKKYKKLFIILNKTTFSSRNKIFFTEEIDSFSIKLHYFDLEKMSSESVDATIVSDRFEFIALAKLRQENRKNLERIYKYQHKTKKLDISSKISHYLWLQQNTNFTPETIKLLSTFTSLETNQIDRKKLKRVPNPLSPLFLNLIEEDSFKFLTENISCIFKILSKYKNLQFY